MLLSAPEAAKQLAVRHEQVLVFIRSGELEAIDVARRGAARPRYRISREAIDAFLRRRTIGSSAVPRKRRQQSDDCTRWVS